MSTGRRMHGICFGRGNKSEQIIGMGRIMFILGAAKGKEPFYEKLGFQIRPNENSGHGMFQWRKKKSNTEG